MPNYVQQAIVYSHFLKRLIDSKQIDETLLNQLVKLPLTHIFFEEFANWSTIIENLDEDELKKKLRQLRMITFAQILTRDLIHLGSLAEVMHIITNLADFSLIKAQALAEKLYSTRYGHPIGKESKKIQHLTIIAMGKMGGKELNVSSDIDLIFTFPEIGMTDSTRSLTNHEFFSKTTQKIISIINDVTEHGRVFRVDIRLRPYGDAGPIVMSESALENYLVNQGREWERYAWIKARVISLYENNIKTLVSPFIYRKYLDYNSFEEMRKLHQQIRQEISRKDLNDNIKLGSGGIREIEFIAQIFQMIKGGQIPDLQLKGTRETLKKLQELGILTTQKTKILLNAYSFLRNLEHRLQYWDDKQTQNLPQIPEEQLLTAKNMGFDDYHSFLNQLNEHRNAVNELFNDIFHEPEQKNNPSKNEINIFWEDIANPPQQIQIPPKYHFKNPESIISQLQFFKQSIAYQKSRPKVQTLFDLLIPKYILAISQQQAADVTLERILEFSKKISGRSAYLAFLNEYPAVIYDLVSILSKSQWISDYLTQHPILLDELISAQLLDTQFDWHAEQKKLSSLLQRAHQDIEMQMEIARKFQHSFIFRLALQELKGLWTVESLADQLSALADIILEEAMFPVWNNYKKAHREKPCFGIIAYGKLGGKELTYHSDLDLVYLYEDDHSESNEIYSWFATRLTSFLSTSTSSGLLYHIDLRLRPNGEAGFLATEFNAFQNYQYHHAWTWEHQALTRARFICGNTNIARKFNQVRKEILMLKRNKESLKKEILEMRSKMLLTHPSLFEDVKHVRGGIADVEFIVQYLILAYASEFPDLTENLGNIALLKIAAKHKLIDDKLADQARAAYRNYRKIAHNAVLHDIPPEINVAELEQNHQNVKKLWKNVFNEDI